MVPTQQTVVSRLYQSVIDDVCTNTREIFLDEGVDESTIQAFKKTWEEKVMSSKAVANHQIQNQGVYMLQQGRSAAPMLLKNGVTQQLLQYSHTPLLSRAAQQAQSALPAGIMFQTGDTRPQKFQVAHVTRTGQLVGNQQIVTSSNVSTTSSNKILQIDGSTDCHEDFNVKNQAGTSNLISKSKNNKLVKRTHRGKIVSKKKVKIVFQFDGENDDTSSEDDDEEEEEDDDDDDDDDDDSDNENGEVEDKDKTVKNEDKELCSDDDVSSEEDPTELFDTDNVVVCQYDKIHRTKSRWKFNLKVGIMSLNGRDHVFQKAVGEANW